MRRAQSKLMGKGPVHIACTCASFFMATSHVSIVTCPGCRAIWTVNGGIYDDIRFPQIFLGSPDACARNVPFLSLKGLGTRLASLVLSVMAAAYEPGL